MLERNKKAIQKLYPSFQPLVTALLERLEVEFKMTPIITDGLRTVEEQKELYAKGRTEPGEIVTYTILGSNHFQGLAVDIAFDKGGKTYYLQSDEHWEKYEKIIYSIPGLEWGYRLWGFDKPHVQMKDGYEGLKLGIRPADYKKLLEKAQKEVGKAQSLMARLRRLATFWKR